MKIKVDLKTGFQKLTNMKTFMKSSKMKRKNDVRNLLWLGMLFLGLVSFFFFYSMSNDGNIFIISFPWRTSLDVLDHSRLIKRDENNFLKDELEEALQKASNKNKTLIITMVNDAYIEGEKSMLDLFLYAFWVGENTRHLVTNLLIVAAGNISYERCKFLRLHCYDLQKIGVQFTGDEKMYLSEDFVQMMWTRTWFLGHVLKRGYNFVFTDTDVLWLRNPFEQLNLHETKDLQISKDFIKQSSVNTGFYMVKSNNKTIQLFDEWYEMKNRSNGKKEQDVLQKLIREGVLERLGIEVKFLNTLYFNGFCQNNGDIKVVRTVHANCCTSIKAKLDDLLVVINEWKRYKNDTKFSEFKWPTHIECRKALRSLIQYLHKQREIQRLEDGREIKKNVNVFRKPKNIERLYT